MVNDQVHTIDALKNHAEPRLEPCVIAAKGVIEIVNTTAHTDLAKHLQVKLEDVHAKTRLAEQPCKVRGAVHAAENSVMAQRRQEHRILGIQATDGARLSRVDGADPLLQRLEHSVFVRGARGFSSEQFLSEGQHDKS